MKHYDVVVVGAGIVGAACALRLLTQGFKVALVDQQLPKNNFTELPQARISAINDASYQLLQDLKVWQDLPHERITPILAMKIFSEASVLQFDAAEFGFAELGFILENEVLQRALVHTFQERSGELFIPYTVENLVRKQDWELQLSGGQALSAKLLVIAQGAQAHLRELLGSKTNIHFYQQKALVMNVASFEPHRLTAYQKFLSTGPLAFLPLFQKNWFSIVWTLPTALADSYQQLSEVELLSKLEAMVPELGALRLLTPVFGFELTAASSEHYVGDQYVLVGDSAHTVHPLAGQGVNMGLMDVVLLSKALAENNNRIDHKALTHYARNAKFRNMSLSKSFSVLNRLFQVKSPLMARMLNFGFSRINHLHGLKLQLMQVARGRV